MPGPQASISRRGLYYLDPGLVQLKEESGTSRNRLCASVVAFSLSYPNDATRCMHALYTHFFEFGEEFMGDRHNVRFSGAASIGILCLSASSVREASSL